MKPNETLIAELVRAWEATRKPVRLQELLQQVEETEQHEILRQLLEVDIKYRRQYDHPVDATNYEELHPKAESIASALIHDESEFHTVRPDEAIQGSSTKTPIPKQIGKYRVIGEIGRGGMGIVYKARESGSLKREVALKVVQGGARTKEAVYRFRTECRALAAMSHPNVASVFEHGEMENGDPYFAMEYIAGKPIIDYCDANQLQLNQRLRLFTEVCDAIHHAHSKSILHRDIKQKNILVTNQDRRVKVIDFGLAKTLNPSSDFADESMISRMNQVVGSLETMSPEQANGEEVDTKTDVYALGAVLYELITGEKPLELGGVLNLDSLTKLNHETPTRPSARVRENGKESSSSSFLRKAGGSSLSNELRGDLDWIALKTLEKDRNRRYDTVLDLKRDIERYLEGLPVDATPQSFSYLFRKSFRLHRSVWLSGFAILATILIALIAITWFYLVAQDNLALAKANERKANSNLTLAKANERKALESEREVAKKNVELKDTNKQLDDERLTAERRARSEPLKLVAQAAKISKFPNLEKLARTSVRSILNPESKHDGRETIHQFWEQSDVSTRTIWQQKLDISADGKFLATGERQGERIRIWDLETGQLLTSFTAHKIPDPRPDYSFGIVADLKFHPTNNRWLYSIGLDGHLKHWDLETGECLTDVSVETPLTSLAINQSQETLFVGDLEGKVREFSLEEFNATGESQVVTLPTNASDDDRLLQRIFDLATLPNGDVVVAAGQGTPLIVSEEAPNSARSPANLQSIAICPDGTKFAAGDDRGNVFLFDTTGKQLQKIASKDIPKESGKGDPEQNYRIRDLTWVNASKLAVAQWNGDIVILDSDAGKVTKRFVGHQKNLYEVADVFSIGLVAGKNQLVSIARDQTIRFWDLLSGENVRTLQGMQFSENPRAFQDSVRFAANARTGKLITCVEGLNSQAILWNLDPLTVESNLKQLPDPTRNRDLGMVTQDVAFSPDGSSFAIMGQSGEISFWRTGEKKYQKVVDAHRITLGSTNPRYQHGRIVWSPDGSKLVSIAHDYKLKVWDTKTRQLVTSFDLRDPEMPIKPIDGSLARTRRILFDDQLLFLPNGTVVTAGRDTYLRIWDIEKKAIKRRVSIGQKISCLAFHSDGKTFAAGSEKGLLFIRTLNDSSPPSIINLDYSASDALMLGSKEATTITERQLIDRWRPGIRGITFHESGDFLAASTGSGTVNLIDVNKSQILQRIHDFENRSNFPATLPVFVGNQLYTVGSNRVVRAWSIRSDGQNFKADESTPVDGAANIAVAAEPERIGVSNGAGKGSVVIWTKGDDGEWRSQTIADSIASPCWIEFIPGSTDVLIATRNGRAVRFDPVQDKIKLEYLGKTNDREFAKLLKETPTLAVSRDGKLAASVWYQGFRREVNVWNLEDGSTVNTIPLPTSVDSIMFDESNSHLFVAMENGNLGAYPIEYSGVPSPVFSINGPQFPTGLCMSLNGELLVQAGQLYNDRTISIFNSEGKELSPLTGEVSDSRLISENSQALSGHLPSPFGPNRQPLFAVRDCDFSPDGKWLVTVGVDYNVVIWKVNGTKVTYFQRYSLLEFESMKRLSAGDVSGLVSVKFSADGKHIYAIANHGMLKQIAFDPDARDTALTNRQVSQKLSERLGLRLIGGRFEAIERNEISAAEPTRDQPTN